ncbi:hypothetical protein H8356DRAFT_364984 [Neocallimastix lanati (nom. inval.)]|jgi:hypothetical protein|uniref:Uncharacterized protein n=1 Tax=Neocallimastix californiae TaxID=1754190 RepID=A0A1Y2EWK4_9FUNG|nr:hypothetical protein H8356DRAFT_364984 [Neocallimastix sp. JGI-2020a]ORY75887.1 hypothetical protein LY90DRAFT_126383 [Neocallimastix californiae]|eukprot:ORY75887.1 hypothetical protein LY90DRAFT_126383 [Neocallimastix californiae]
MVQKSILSKESFSFPEGITETVDKKSMAEETSKKRLFENIFKTSGNLVYSKSLNCLPDVQKNNTENNGNNNDNVSIKGLGRKYKSLNELYFLNKQINKFTFQIELNKNRANSTSKIDKCVRFNDDIIINELNDEYDRKPMPLAKMYYKDQVELYQLREQMKQIQYRIINNIKGNVLLDE